jgi:hypothetical protein
LIEGRSGDELLHHGLAGLPSFSVVAGSVSTSATVSASFGWYGALNPTITDPGPAERERARSGR